MSAGPVICFGQQPSGIFPRRFLYAKIVTARRLQAELGGRIVFFYHDSDHDPRETQTLLTDRRTGAQRRLNFEFENKLQRKYSPLYLKRIPAGWQEATARRLPALVDEDKVGIFQQAQAACVADFCLEMYRGMGLLQGMDIARSSDPAFRNAACDVADFFVDIPHEGETVRARHAGDHFELHAGGSSFIKLPLTGFGKSQVSPTRDTRLRWMQSVIQCTHYVSGAGEQDYLNLDDAPGVQFIKRDFIERSDEAWTAEG
jgi:hypothetical protein